MHDEHAPWAWRGLFSVSQTGTYAATIERTSLAFCANRLGAASIRLARRPQTCRLRRLPHPVQLRWPTSRAALLGPSTHICGLGYASLWKFLTEQPALLQKRTGTNA